MTDKNSAHDEHEEEIIYVSRAELKRDAMEVRDLGEEISTMAKKQRDTIPLSEELIAAMATGERIKPKTDAFRRHLNFVAKLLRQVDNLEEIQHAVDVIKNKHQLGNVLAHKIEHIRDEVVAKGDGKINQLVEQYPMLERQKMRQLVRQAKKEQEQQKPGKAYKELFQYLKKAIHE